MGLTGLMFLLLATAVASLPAFLLARLLPASWPWFRYVTAIVVFSLLVMPSWGVATIIAVPVPFAFTLIPAVIDLDLSGIVFTLQEWPLWHAIAFPITVLFAALIFRRLRPNNSFKPKPLRGSA